jgi:hypothetical protein
MARRFIDYFNNSFLTQIKNKMAISKALLKYGYLNFKLEILDKKIYIYFLIKYIYFIYCDSDNVIEREQYYLDLLKPEYNRFFLYPQATKKNYIIYYIYNMPKDGWILLWP